MRHFATPFAYSDAMWKKYGAVWGKLLKHKDPKTKKIALRNTLNTSEGAKPQEQQAPKTKPGAQPQSATASPGPWDPCSTGVRD